MSGADDFDLKPTGKRPNRRSILRAIAASAGSWLLRNH